MVGCKPDSPSNPQPIPNADHGVFVCNEGNFNYDNASLSFYDPAANTVVARLPLYHNGYLFPLGDVCQSMFINKGRGFIVVNNSAKIYVIDTKTNAYIGKIGGLTSPRYIHFVSDTKAYVSDLYSNSMTIINPSTLEITGYLPVGRSTESMVADGGSLYVTSWSYSRKVYKIDTATDRVTDSMTVPLQPNSIVLDRNRKLWVLSDGSYEGSPAGHEPAALTRIDAASFALEQSYTFADIAASPSKLAISGDGDRLFYLNTGGDNAGLFSMSNTGADALPTVPFIAAQGRLFYALGIDPRNSDIYISDAIDYMQRGVVFRYTSAGELITTFKVDIIPGSFCFKNE